MGRKKIDPQKAALNLRRKGGAPASKSSGFIPSFLGFFLLLFSASILLPDWAADGLGRFTAASSGLILLAFGLPVVIHGRFLALDQFRVEIIPECTALYPVMLLAAFVLAYPASLRKKASGILAGTVFLLAINTFRIAAVVYVGSLSRLAFHILHTYFGQVAMMAAVIGLCLAWARRAGDSAPPQAAVVWKRMVPVSAILFAGWLLVDKAYVAMNDSLVEAWFFFWGREIVLQRQHPLYFETFNLPFFTSLVLAVPKTTAFRKCRGLVLGTLAIWGGHVLFRLGNAYLIFYRKEFIFLLTNSITLLSQYLLTFILWHVLVARHRDRIKSSVSHAISA